MPVAALAVDVERDVVGSDSDELRRWPIGVAELVLETDDRQTAWSGNQPGDLPTAWGATSHSPPAPNECETPSVVFHEDRLHISRAATSTTGRSRCL